MTDLDRNLLAAWSRIRPILLSDPAELHRRLARRRSPTLRRPPRPWCLAVRASDTRINHATAIIEPEWAIDPARNPYGRWYDEHTVFLTNRLLGKLCRGVFIDAPGEDWLRIARRLGVHPETLRYTMRCGSFQVRRIPRLAGKRGKPTPVLFSPELFDPAGANHHQAPDPRIWDAYWTHLADTLPHDLEQPVRRIPVYRRYRLHEDRLRFRGWRWQCPACRKSVRTIYYPAPPLALPKLPAAIRHLDADAVEPPLPAFACVRCHRIRYFSRATGTIARETWNQLVAYRSGGLLYGCEVPRPEWWDEPARQRSYRPRLVRPAPRRQQVLELLLRGLSYREIAAEMQISWGTVHAHVKEIYRQHRVHSRAELARRNGVRLLPRPTKPRQVRARLAVGQSPEAIARTMGLSREALRHHLKATRREDKAARAALPHTPSSRRISGGASSGRSDHTTSGRAAG